MSLNDTDYVIFDISKIVAVYNKIG